MGFFYYSYRLSQNYFISLDKIYSKKTNKKYLNLNLENIIKKIKLKFRQHF